MIPGVVTFVPLFVLVANAGLVDTLPGLFLPFLAAPFGVFLMRQFILGLPRDLLDAGRVDGAGELRIFARIILPLCGPALATLGILTFLGSWNNFLWPLVVAQTETRYTLPVALALYSTGQNSTQYGLLLAGATVVVLPMLLVFLVFQRRVHRRHRHHRHQVIGARHDPPDLMPASRRQVLLGGAAGAAATVLAARGRRRGPRAAQRTGPVARQCRVCRGHRSRCTRWAARHLAQSWSP